MKHRRARSKILRGGGCFDSVLLKEDISFAYKFWGTLRKTFVSPMMGCWRFSNPRILGAVAASQQTFLLSPDPIQANTLGEVTKKCRGLDLGPLKIYRIGKTPTPHHRKNAALPTLPLPLTPLARGARFSVSSPIQRGDYSSRGLQFWTVRTPP